MHFYSYQNRTLHSTWTRVALTHMSIGGSEIYQQFCYAFNLFWDRTPRYSHTLCTNSYGHERELRIIEMLLISIYFGIRCCIVFGPLLNLIRAQERLDQSDPRHSLMNHDVLRNLFLFKIN